MINSNYDKYNLLFEAVVINSTRPKRPLIWLVKDYPQNSYARKAGLCQRRIETMIG